MSDPNDGLSEVMPSATPSDAEIAAWEALPRDEQLRRLRAALTHPDCYAVSDLTMEEIRDRARAAAKARREQIKSSPSAPKLRRDLFE